VAKQTAKAKKKAPASERHLRRFAVQLPPEYRGPIEAAAGKGRRTVVSEVCIALEAHLAQLGLWPAEGGRP
jgi:hypothetical protein